MSKQADRLAAARQQQFLDVVSRDEATTRFQSQLNMAPLGVETVPLDESLNHILAADVIADVDVSGFDRSNVDGFAVRAADTIGAMEERPRVVLLNNEVLAPGLQPQETVLAGTATTIATGGMLPRGADAVVMIEHTELLTDASGENAQLEIQYAISPGDNLTFAGTDIALGECVLRAGQPLTSREIGVLAAIGHDSVEVFQRPRVAIVSTGNEIVPPGQPRPPGAVYDSNLAILTAAVTELGGHPVPLGIVSDDETQLRDFVKRGLECDVVVLSGGTSKGAGDLSYRVVSELTDPGIVAHGVALKPGKPICLAVTAGKPVVILPGFPTSAIFTFHEFVAPVIRAMAGRGIEQRQTVAATLPMKINSQRGRTEYLLVSLMRAEIGLVAYPMGKGSGSVTTYSGADGFITIGQHVEILEAGADVEVQMLSQDLKPADLIVIGSHCTGLDFLLGEVQQAGYSTKSLFVGSMGGLTAAKRNECDIAGIHLMDAKTGEYNRPFLTDGQTLVTGYQRMQSFVFRPDDTRFAGLTLQQAIDVACCNNDGGDEVCTMVNRNAGSGTRIVIDQLLAGRRPAGYPVQAKSHHAVATAIQQGRADWGIAIESVAHHYGLACLPVQQEHYDFVIPRSRAEQPAVKLFCQLLQDDHIQTQLKKMGFNLTPT